MAYDWEKHKNAMGTLDDMLGFPSKPSRMPSAPFNAVPPAQAAPNIFDTRNATPQDYAQMRSTIPNMGKISRGVFDYEDDKTGYAGATLPSGDKIGAQGLEIAQGSTGYQTYQAPGGGTYTVPQGTFKRTPQQMKNVEEHRIALGLPAGTDPVAAEEQQRKINEAKAGIGARQIIKSLREINMSDEDIKREIGFTPSMSKTEVFKRLKNLGTGESATSPDAQTRSVRMERIGQKADRASDGTPANAAALAQDYEAYLNQPSADPMNDKSNREYMNPTQKREYDRFIERVAYGKPDEKQKERVSKIMVDVAIKRQNEENLIKAKAAKEAIRAGINAAKDEYNGNAKVEWYKEKSTRIKALEAKRENKYSWSETDQKKLDWLLDEVAAGYQPTVAPAPSAPKQQAPAAAIAYLKANPEQASAFKAKYGYLPEGL